MSASHRSLQGRNHHVNLVCQILFGLGASTHVGGMGGDPSWWIWTSWRSCYGSVKIIKPHILGETTVTGNSSQMGIILIGDVKAHVICRPKKHIWYCSHSFIVFPSSLSHPISLHFLFPSLHKINMKHIGKSLVSQTRLALCHPRSQSSTMKDNHKNPCRKEYSLEKMVFPLNTLRLQMPPIQIHTLYCFLFDFVTILTTFIHLLSPIQT